MTANETNSADTNDDIVLNIFTPVRSTLKKVQNKPRISKIIPKAPITNRSTFVFESKRNDNLQRDIKETGPKRNANLTPIGNQRNRISTEKIANAPTDNLDQQESNIIDNYNNSRPNISSVHRSAFKNEHYIKKQPVASLFKHNPDIPVIHLKNVNQKDQAPLFSSDEFASLNLHPHLVAGLQSRLKATRLTAVQKATIPKLMEGKDALVKSLTGSGKTLAYAVPIIQALQERRPKINRSEGIQALVILPTRELAIQSFECFVNLCRAFTWLVPGYLTGGEKKKSEKARIRKGITVLVSTPGRLVDHLLTTTSLDLQNVQWLVIDEADRLMELGFEESVAKIVSHVQKVGTKKRQTVLLSATLSRGVESMAGLALNEPTVINISANESETNLTMNNEAFAFPTHLQQHFCFIPLKLRLVALSSFMLDQSVRGQFKALVFMPAQDVVDFHYHIFTSVLQKALVASGLSITLFKLHGNMKQADRVQAFKDFREAKVGVLLCTDVAARGLDLPHVDWILQYSAPSTIEDYVHRIGRTARIGTKGHSLIFLLPAEKAYLTLMQEHKISAKEIVLADMLPAIKLILPSLISNGRRQSPKTVEEFATALQDLYERLISNSDQGLQFARQGYTAYVRAYSSYPKIMRDILPFKSLHLGHLAKSFCLAEAPSDLSSKLVGMMNYEPRKTPKRLIDQTSFRQSQSVKRSANISEFDSGFKAIKKAKKDA